MNNTRNILVLKIIDILEFLMLLVVFIDVNSVYTEAIWNHKLPTQSGVHTYAKLVCFVLAVVLCAMHIVYDKANLECVKKYKYFAIFQGVFLLLFYIVNVMQTYDGEGYIEAFFLCMSVMPLLFKIYRREGKAFTLLYKLEYIVLFVAVISTLLWFGSSVLNLLGEAEDINVLWGGNYYESNYLNFCFRRYWEDDITKNLGIFPEPPMFGLFLNIAIYTELFLKKRTNIYILAGLLAGMFSCRATLALMVVLLGIMLKIVDLLSDKKWIKPVLIGLGVVGVCCVTILSVHKMKVAYPSFVTHLDDYIAPFQCFIHNNWLWGCGYDNLEPIIKYQSAFRSDNPGMSNSVMAVLAQGGLMLTAYYLAPIVIIIGAFFKKNRKLAYWGVGFLALYVLIIFYLRVLVFVMLALGYSMIDVEVFKNKPFVKLTISYPDDNLAKDDQKDKWYHKCRLNNGYKMPFAMNLAMLMFPIFISCFTFFTVGRREVSSIICAAFSLLVALGMIIWKVFLLKRNVVEANDYSNWFYISQIVVYVSYICIGHMYAITEDFLRSNKLLLQDSQWNFVIFVIITYLVLSVCDFANKEYIARNSKIIAGHSQK